MKRRGEKVGLLVYFDLTRADFLHVTPWMADSKHASEDVLRSGSLPGGVLTSLMATNAAVFGCWEFHGGQNAQMRKVRNAMLGHLMCSRWHLQKGRWHTLFTSCVFHQRLAHCFFNSFALWTVGGVAAEKLTNSELACVFAVSALGSSGGHVLLHRQPVLGASGMLMGVLSASTILQPERRFGFIPLILPFPNTSFSLAELTHVSFFANLFGFALRRYGAFQQVAWAAHISGACTGLGIAWLAHLAGDTRFADPLAVHKTMMDCN